MSGTPRRSRGRARPRARQWGVGGGDAEESPGGEGWRGMLLSMGARPEIGRGTGVVKSGAGSPSRPCTVTYNALELLALDPRPPGGAQALLRHSGRRSTPWRATVSLGRPSLGKRSMTAGAGRTASCSTSCQHPSGLAPERLGHVVSSQLRGPGLIPCTRGHRVQARCHCGVEEACDPKRDARDQASVEVRLTVTAIHVLSRGGDGSPRPASIRRPRRPRGGCAEC